MSRREIERDFENILKSKPKVYKIIKDKCDRDDLVAWTSIFKEIYLVRTGQKECKERLEKLLRETSKSEDEKVREMKKVVDDFRNEMREEVSKIILRYNPYFFMEMGALYSFVKVMAKVLGVEERDVTAVLRELQKEYGLEQTVNYPRWEAIKFRFERFRKWMRPVT